MNIIPTITDSDVGSYRRNVLRLFQVSRRLHIDVADGELAPTKLISPEKLWWPDTAEIDVHVMYQYPMDVIKVIMKRKPRMIILHAEAEGDFGRMAGLLHRSHIRFGVAVLPETDVAILAPAINHIQQVLIFGGHLGYQGGEADLKQLRKVTELRNMHPTLDIAWDGGVNNTTIVSLAKAGIDTANVGGYISNAVNPFAAYVTLQALAGRYNETLKHTRT